MTQIIIYPEPINGHPRQYRAVAGEAEVVEPTVGRAIDAIREKVGGSAFIVVDPYAPDEFFTAEQQRRLGELLAVQRAARDAGRAMPAELEDELTALVWAEVEAAGKRAAARFGRPTRT